MITFASFGVGAIIGIPLAAARSARWRIGRSIAIDYVETFRGIPPIA